MPVELHVADDFDAIIDLFEAVTLKRRGSATTSAIPKAWRYSSLTRQAEPGLAGVAQDDVVWQFHWGPGIDPPRIGDSLIDAANNCWTILSVEARGANTRLQCVARNLQIVHQLVDRVEIQAAVWEDSGGGPEIVGWMVLRSVVPARIQPSQTSIDNTVDPPTSIATFRIVLADDTPLDHNHRILGADGTVYQLLTYSDADRIDTLPVATVKRLVTA